MSFDVRQLGSNLPEGWSYKRLGDVAAVNGNSIKKKDAPKYISYVDISSVSTGSFEQPTKMAYAEAPSRARRRLQKNDFIISTVRPNLKQYAFIEYVEDNWVASTGFCVVSTYDANAAWYLYAVVTSELFNDYLVRVADGGAYPAFNPKEIEDAVILWPDHKSLVFLNDFVMQINQKVKINTQTNQTLEEMAQAIFKSWFVDFDPVKAKMNGEQPEGMDAATASLFPDKLVESELGLIPEGWSISELGEYLDVLETGKRPKGGVKGITEGIPSVGAENILGVGKYEFGKEKFIPEELFNSLKKGVIESEDVLIYKDGGKPGDFKPRFSMFGYGFPYQKFAINEHVFRIRSNKLGQSYLYCQMCDGYVYNDLRNKGAKAAIPGINQKDVNSLRIVVPDEQILAKFNESVRRFFEMILKNSLQSQELAKLRDTLLPKLLSGEIELQANA